MRAGGVCVSRLEKPVTSERQRTDCHCWGHVGRWARCGTGDTAATTTQLAGEDGKKSSAKAKKQLCGAGRRRGGPALRQGNGMDG